MSAEESNALVEIDGKPVGFTPALIQALQLAHADCVLSYLGFRRWNETSRSLPILSLQRRAKPKM
jgi:hypothetical protein